MVAYGAGQRLVAKLTFELKDRAGTMLLSHTDGKYDWDPESTIQVGPQQVYDTPALDNRTEDQWLKLGTDQEMNGKVVLALETYQAAIQKHPEALHCRWLQEGWLRRSNIMRKQ